MIDIDRVVEKFMLFSIIGSITAFILFGVGIVPLVVVWLIFGLLVIVGGSWIMEDIRDQ